MALVAAALLATADYATAQPPPAAPAVASGYGVSVACLELADDAPRASRLALATAQLTAAAQRGADIALLPEGWAEGWAAAQAYAQLASELGIAIGATYTTTAAAPTAANSSMALFSMNGSLALHYTVPAATPSRPTAGATPPVTSLTTRHGTVLVGAMLGTDYMFMEPARVLMVQGAELTLNAVRVANLSADRETKFFDALREDNSINYVTCNYGSISGMPAGGSGCTSRHGPQRRYCAPVSGPTASTVGSAIQVSTVNISAYRTARQTGGVWGVNMDFL
eukprot:COSAG01_NODE_19521_length_1005_cov_1.110375_1_plen_280_part_10